jgi:Fe-S-cluster containining protein
MKDHKMGKASRLKKTLRDCSNESAVLSNGLVELLENVKRSSKSKFKDVRSQIIPALKHMIDQIAAYPPGPDRAKGVHQGIDEELKQEFEKNGHTEKITCKRGCAFCCHLLVAVTSDEADLLVDCIRGGVDIDRELLAEQTSWPESGGVWLHKPPEKNRCVFLGKDNDCRVYENRPAACRTYYSVDAPSKCDVSTGSVMHNKVISVQGEIAYSALLTVSPSGYMSKMLSERLKG